LSADQTKEAILDAAERLFAEQGFDATSLRAVTAEAGTNLAAVNYHFGSKSALLPAVVARILVPVCQRQLVLLDEIEARDLPPTLEELLEAFTSPITDLFEQGRRGPVLARMFARIMGDPGDEMQRMAMSEVGDAEERYEAAFARLLPEIPPAELWWRFRSIGPVVVSRQIGLQASPDVGGPPTPAEADAVALRAWTMTFLAAAMRAPATVQAPAAVTSAVLSNA